MEETLSGYVEHIVFRNEENGYTVLNLVSDSVETTCVGIFSAISEGESIEAKGVWSVHPMYGEQFKVSSFSVTMPEDVVSMERYLASGAIKGIGAALATRIVKRFGDQTFRIIEEEPERLAEVKGISDRKAREIAVQMVEKRDMRNAMLFLQQYGISMALSIKIYQAYGQELYGIISKNPYKIADDIPGVGFKTADEIAQQVGIRMDSEFRICSGIIYILQQASLQGHTCLPQDILTRNTAHLLGVDPEDVEKQYMDMMIDRRLIRQERDGIIYVYASVFYHMESNVAFLLSQLRAEHNVPDEQIEERIRLIEQQMSREAERTAKMQRGIREKKGTGNASEEGVIHLDAAQIEAVKASVKNGLVVITGGPGTGKTTTINTIIRYFDEAGLDILLAAPTGRAAKRMSETTGYEAQTIHRMLEVSGDVENDAGFDRNEEYPLEADVIIIDEMSMVDLSLMNALLKAIVPGTRLILVGDVNQLPSVGAGRVLGDIIDSGVCKTVKLTHIFRQAAQSDIIVNAHRINAGEQVVLDNKSRDFFFLKRNDANVIISICIQLIKEKLPPYTNSKPFDIQLMTPMRKGVLGVERFNTILQENLNPPEPTKAEIEHGGIRFREGDKVMQIKNNYQMEWKVLSRYGIPVESGTGVFNGDMGVIRSIDTFTEIVTVEYEEKRMAEYTFSQLDELELAYAITIHKAQGSEYPAVVIPLLTGPQPLMSRNLLYTAVTRARHCVVLVGDDQTFARMIENDREQARYSGLLAQLQGYVEEI